MEAIHGHTKDERSNWNEIHHPIKKTKQQEAEHNRRVNHTDEQVKLRDKAIKEHEHPYWDKK